MEFRTYRTLAKEIEPGRAATPRLPGRLHRRAPANSACFCGSIRTSAEPFLRTVNDLYPANRFRAFVSCLVFQLRAASQSSRADRHLIPDVCCGSIGVGGLRNLWTRKIPESPHSTVGYRPIGSFASNDVAGLWCTQTDTPET